MSGLGTRLYTDEDVDPRLAQQLRERGYDAISCRDAGNDNQGLSDDWQLGFATQQGRAILIHNIVDYVALDRAWRAHGQHHGGIIYVENGIRIGELVRRTQRHLDTVSPDYQGNIVLHLVA